MKIVLVGYMGSGKSTVGKLLAKRLGIKFLDLDSYIESREGCTIPELFARKGEIYFRKREHQLLKEVLDQNESLVLATGGGTPCYGNNMDTMLSAAAHVVYLKLNIPELITRLSPEKEGRPLIKNIPDDELAEFIGKHLFERAPFYERAGLILTSGAIGPDMVVQNIVQSISTP